MKTIAISLHAFTSSRRKNEDIEQILEDAELDEAQEAKLEHEFAREYHLITRDDRLETIAKDIASHFIGRGYQGKTMVISIDKATAVKMFDKVQKYWKRLIKQLKSERTSLRTSFNCSRTR